MSFGRNLERIRKDKKVSQTTLAQELGLTQQMISSYEKNVSSPNIETLIKIADYFNISIDTLVGHKTSGAESVSPNSRFLKYFEALNDPDREKCITIARTLLQDRELSRKKI